MTTHPPLRQALADYLALRRALGFKLDAAGRILGQFVDWLDAQQAPTPTIEHAAGLGEPARPGGAVLAGDPVECGREASRPTCTASTPASRCRRRT